MLNFIGSKLSALGSMDMDGLKSISMGRDDKLPKSITSENGFVCPRSLSGQSADNWDQSGGLPPSQEDSSIDESPLPD